MTRRSRRSGSVAIGAAAGALMVAASVASPREASAQTRINPGFYYRNLTVMRLNPLGLFEELRLGFRYRIARPDTTEVLFQNTYAGITATGTVSPAFFRPGILVEAQPLSILYLYAQYEYTRYFGNFNFIQSFPTASRAPVTPGGPPAIDYSDRALAANQNERREAYSTSSHQMTLGFTLQVKVDNFAIRSASRFVYVDLDTNAGGTTRNHPVYYDPFFDALMPTRGWTYTNDTDFLYVSTFGLIAGVRYSQVNPLYGDNAFPGGPAERAAAPSNLIARVGPLFAYTFTERRHSWFNAPTAIVGAGWWLHHPYRTGQEVSGAVPYIIIGFSFRGDL